jgi:Zn-dependent protease
MDDPYNLLVTILVYAPSVVLAITLHEAAHGYVAKHFGDTTAYMLGRVTLNPVKHIDPIGTIVVPLLLAFATQGRFLFGWAKPVPVNFNNLRHPKRDMLWVAAAGPGSNLVQAALWALLAKALLATAANPVATYWFSVAEAGILVNVIFAILNLFPILPLDGGRIVTSLLPTKLSYAYQGTERYGMIILIVLIATGVLGTLLSPLVFACVQGIYSLFGLQ